MSALGITQLAVLVLCAIACGACATQTVGRLCTVAGRHRHGANTGFERSDSPSLFHHPAGCRMIDSTVAFTIYDCPDAGS